MAPATPTDQDDRLLPSEGWRTAISLLLFVHLFAVSVALISNATMYPSRLMDKIRGSLLRQYLYTTWLDVGYQYDHLGAAELDFPHRLVGEMQVAGESPHEVNIEPPEARGIRHQRYAKLASTAASWSEEPSGESILPSAIGGSLLKQAGASDPGDTVIFRIQRTPIQSLDIAHRSGLLELRPQTVYQSKVRLIDGRGSVVEKQTNRGVIRPGEATDTSSPDASSAVPPAAGPSSNPSGPATSGSRQP